MKKCFKCDTVKPLSEFYKHPKMSDGHLNKCKGCVKEYQSSHRKENSEYYSEYDHWRLKRNGDRRVTAKNPEATMVSRKLWEVNNPEKSACHRIVNIAVKNGLLVKPDKCSNCGNFFPIRRIHAHHSDYSRPLDVTWLCVHCHASEHSKSRGEFTPRRSRK